MNPFHFINDLLFLFSFYMSSSMV
uniref:Uncharacterized protein n=1 Tax=Arundo donax TaxID=35708 RepID=A0A0A9FFD8_ARUDO